ncbi:hypothetical protein CJ301_02615 [Limimaricola cinnabarinus]|jgi:hypothetical protein|uniref:Hedgehog/Intein (Hint) domain-containing protein n=1 Tax=Limimaricola cinnabarinus TaxID=1125964 RepID=A0A2G1ML08_9RHOB|nr:hypothetical protein CJ301_02615 [Limimaricola cinnabarinus]
MIGNSRKTSAHAETGRTGLLAGTRIATPSGARAVETLRPGDLVLTRDHGLQPVLRLEAGPSDAADAPLRLLPAALPGLERALRLPPRQRVLLRGARIARLFGESEVLVEAAHLAPQDDIRRGGPTRIVGFGLVLPRAELIWAEGAALESHAPQDSAPARRCLGWHEAARLRADQGFGTVRPLGTASGTPSRPAAATGSLSASRNATSASISPSLSTTGGAVTEAPIAPASSASSRMRQSAASMRGRTACARS